MHLFTAVLAHPFVFLTGLVLGTLAGFLAAKLAKPTTLVGKVGSEVGKL